jgi:hypothetical protein
MAQWTCKEPASNEWLRQAPPTTKETAIPDSLVQPVAHDLERAISLLRDRSFIRLSNSDANTFAGGASPSVENPVLRPYLVRAVFPVANPRFRLSWSGNNLHVFLDGLGCAAFIKHPLVVFLDREPSDVFVMASAAL